MLHLISLSFQTKDAFIFDKVLALDKIQIGKVPITREISHSSNELKITFESEDLKLLRTVVNSLFDHMLLINETIEMHQIVN